MSNTSLQHDALLKSAKRSIYPTRFVFNVLTITGPNEELKRFRAYCQGIDSRTGGGIGDFNHLCFDTIIPLGGIRGINIFELEDLRQQIWGCPSVAHGVSVKQTSNLLRFSFTTFENGPRFILQKLREEFSSLSLEIDAKYQ